MRKSRTFVGGSPDDLSRGRAHRGPMSDTPRLCRLNETVGVAEECPEEACPFWEAGGAVLPGRCAFEGLDLAGRRDLAGYLLRIREGLHSAERGAKREAHRLFIRRLNEGRGD
jgi:hypothetical protein